MEGGMVSISYIGYAHAGSSNGEIATDLILLTEIQNKAYKVVKQAYLLISNFIFYQTTTTLALSSCFNFVPWYFYLNEQFRNHNKEIITAMRIPKILKCETFWF